MARRIADQDLWPGTREEIGKLCIRIGRVVRQKNRSRADRAKIQHDGLRRLFDLRGNPVARFRPERDKRSRIARR